MARHYDPQQNSVSFWISASVFVSQHNVSTGGLRQKKDIDSDNPDPDRDWNHLEASAIKSLI